MVLSCSEHKVRISRLPLGGRGDGDLYNASLVLEGRQLLEMDGQEGILIGVPQSMGATMFKVHNDFREGCIDDLRISGRSAPLPPAVNNTPWGQASVFKGVERGCVAPSACTNVSCRTPLSCVDTWRSHHCGSVPNTLAVTSHAHISPWQENVCLQRALGNSYVIQNQLPQVWRGPRAEPEPRDV
ncbi:putative neural-cadherin 2 [Chionoecetes opilio]|uniref:Putative neural-cadherin 2 n=1 Tax=Chionoecetes opilio TaxID=41210 RepID=A0A8J5CUC0_CHIOP|nr:putative neural-cadherin 2 [Chionoecetes opilio]